TPTPTPTPVPTLTPTPTPTPTPDPAPTTDPAPAPDPTPQAVTGVEATAEADGSVTVRWTPAPAADSYLVRPVGGSGTNAPAGASSVRISDAPRGTSVRYEVVTRLGSQQAVSAPSGAVTVADVPTVVTGLSAALSSRTATQLQVAVSFGAASANGSPVTGYRVSYSGGGVSGATDLGAGATSTTLTIDCTGQGLCTAGGQLRVEVVAANAVGQGPAAAATTTVPEPDPTEPRSGDSLPIGFHTGGSGAETGTGYVTLTGPPAWWAGHPGGCRVEVVAGLGMSQDIPCAGGTVRIGHNTGSMREVTVRVVALGNGAASATETFWWSGRADHHWCDDQGRCYDPVSLPDPGVEIVPAPWTPPQVPNPPVLTAGVGLLGLAAAFRLTRPTTRQGAR
ncbi:MAG: hypothetical protein ACTMIR_10435, partial [Cellulomonadaceae bacterium]